VGYLSVSTARGSIARFQGGGRMSEESAVEVFKLKKSDVVEVTIQTKVYTWTCPLCNRIISTYYRDKTLSSAKLHLERVHKFKVEVE
jgi:hypothetical protein